MPIVKKSLSEQIYEDLRGKILSGEIPFGEKITNRELQMRYGVSSTPVRDVVNYLYRDGLVESPTKAGTRVITFDIKHALEINEVLSLLGVWAVRLSSRRANVAAVSLQLESVLKRQQKNIGNDRYYDYDREFHGVFVEHSDNRELKSIYHQYHMLHEMLVRCYHKAEDSREASVQGHRKILDAYSRGDVDLACSHMRDHYEAAEGILAAVLR